MAEFLPISNAQAEQYQIPIRPGGSFVEATYLRGTTNDAVVTNDNFPNNHTLAGSLVHRRSRQTEDGPVRSNEIIDVDSALLQHGIVGPSIAGELDRLLGTTQTLEPPESGEIDAAAQARRFLMSWVSLLPEEKATITQTYRQLRAERPHPVHPLNKNIARAAELGARLTPGHVAAARAATLHLQENLEDRATEVSTHRATEAMRQFRHGELVRQTGATINVALQKLGQLASDPRRGTYAELQLLHEKMQTRYQILNELAYSTLKNSGVLTPALADRAARGFELARYHNYMLQPVRPLARRSLASLGKMTHSQVDVTVEALGRRLDLWRSTPLDGPYKERQQLLGEETALLIEALQAQAVADIQQLSRRIQERTVRYCLPGETAAEVWYSKRLLNLPPQEIKNAL